MKTILFQGDSITDCGRIRGENQNGFVKLYNTLKHNTPLGSGYPSLVAKELGETYIYENRGVSGDRILDVYARIVRDIIKIKPDYMSLLVGVNDIWHGFDWNNGTGTERFIKVYNILIEELEAELPDMKIMLMEPFVLEGTATKNRPDQPDRYVKFRSGVEELASEVRKIAEEHSLKFIPLQSMLDEAAKSIPADKLLSDGVHPTEEGHRIITKEWIKAFEEIR